LTDLVGKEPATIAVSVAADLVRVFESERSSSPDSEVAQSSSRGAGQ
jgi:xanthine/CO dehydrogenase XdhC/CoxF family maturation factor